MSKNSSASKKKVVKDFIYQTPFGPVTIEGESVFSTGAETNELMIPGTLIDSWNQKILKKLLRNKSRFSAGELQFVFSVLPYSQNEIAIATGKDRSTLTKYKLGENPIDLLFDHTLREIVGDFLNGTDKTLKELLALQESKAEPAGYLKVSAG